MYNKTTWTEAFLRFWFLVHHVIPPSDRKHCTLWVKRAMNYGSWFCPFMFQTEKQWSTKWLPRGFCWWLMAPLVFLLQVHKMTHLRSSSPQSQTRQTGRGKRQLRFPNLIFTISPRPLPSSPALTRCASHRTPCWLQTALPWRDRWGTGLCRSAWLETRNALLLPPPPSSFPNGSYQTHQEICDRTVLRPWEDCHQLPQRWRIMCKCFASVRFLSLCACQ